MRKDPSASEGFLDAKSWKNSNHSAEPIRKNPSMTGSKFVSHSLSGGEWNHWFIQAGNDFINLTPLSGLDTDIDGRSHALLDYDRDGWMDVVLVSAEAPRTQLFRNRLGDLVSERRKRLFIQLEGGNQLATRSKVWSPRDGYGAVIEITTSLGKRVLQHQAGEGLSAQNSDTVSIGLKAGEEVHYIQVFWPSGKDTKHSSISDKPSRIFIRERGSP